MINGALKAIKTVADRISARLSRLTKAEFRDRVLRLIQEDITQAMEEIEK